MRKPIAHRRGAALATSAALALLALAGCSATGGGSLYSTPSPAGGTSASTSPAASSGIAVRTGSTSLGTVVVDGKGRTAYVFDKDTPNAGTSACTGACAAQWPAIETDSAKPAVTGVTGTVGTIAGVDGKKQVTLDGRPLYTFSGDSSAGDVTGQGLGGIWWVVAPDGTKVSSASPSSGSGGYTK